MIKTGLTGGIGSGKTTVARAFEALGIPVFYADDEAKKFLLQPGVKSQIREFFGSKVFYRNGEIDKAALASVIFNDASALQKINGLIHPLVKQRFLQWAAGQQAPFVVMEVAILFENNFDEVTDKNIVVVAPDKLRAQRAASRDGVPVAEIRQRMSHQWPQDELIKRADFVIDNSGEQLILPRILELYNILSSC